MDCQIKLIKKIDRGFSLVEIVLVLGIFGLLTGISTTVYSSFKAHENLEIATTGVVEAIRHAQSNAQTGKTDSEWGIETLSRSVVVFRGSSYATRTVSSDQIFGLPGGVTASGLSEMVFAKVTGSTVNTGTVILTNRYGIKNISINAKVTLTY